MNPSSNETSGLQLPPPVAEQVPVAASVPAEAGPGSTAEQGNNSENQARLAAGAAASMQIPLTVPTNLAPAVSGQAASNTASGVSPTMADDNDLIEKEWVHKAKQIVERTREDPYKQSEELTVVKVDYMKRRYNKTVKTN